ncbi:MAG: tRNA (guanosine(37)-N1)-methyltransferase TrmD [Hyphomicrobiaceae bacterium]
MLTLFPDAFPGPLGLSLVGTAREAGIWSLETVDIRAFGHGRHRTVDDHPAGGGAGMVLRCDVAAAAIDHARQDGGGELPLIYVTPRGERLSQALVRDLAEGPGLIVLSGRFEGIDQRVIEARGMREVSLGDFVMSGGEIAAMAMIDACVRLLPGVLGGADSLDEESFSGREGSPLLLEYPQYTRPRDWEGRRIPEVLLSGDHRRIAAWRREEAERTTAERRPDLLAQRKV